MSFPNQGYEESLKKVANLLLTDFRYCIKNLTHYGLCQLLLLQFQKASKKHLYG